MQKYLAHCGVAARRRAETEYIAAGRVTVNGRTVTDPATRVAAGDMVCVDGRPIRPERRVTVLLHKPAGVVSAASDTRGRPTASGLVGPGLGRLYPVGRLDEDSEGLLLLTNDGGLTARLLHPRFGVARTYAALVSPPPRPEHAVRLEAGVRLSDGPARARSARLLAAAPEAAGPPAAAAPPGDAPGGSGWVELVLAEGRNREVRRMCAAVGLQVLRLLRTGFGPLRLGALPSGRWRALSRAELRSFAPAPERRSPPAARRSRSTAPHPTHSRPGGPASGHAAPRGRRDPDAKGGRLQWDR